MAAPVQTTGHGVPHTKVSDWEESDGGLNHAGSALAWPEYKNDRSGGRVDPVFGTVDSALSVALQVDYSLGLVNNPD